MAKVTFSPKTWENEPSTATPISAEALTDLEERIADYSLEASESAEDWHYVGEDGEPAFENDWQNPNARYTLDLQAKTAGQFKLTVNGGTPSANIDFDADDATIQAALEGTAEVAPGDVSVTEQSPPDPGVAGGQFTVEFVGDLAGESVTLTITDGTTPLDPALVAADTLVVMLPLPEDVVRFYKFGERVFIEGSMVNPSSSAAAIFTFPADYRPDRTVTSTADNPLDLSISTAGVVTAVAESVFKSFGLGFSFRVA